MPDDDVTNDDVQKPKSSEEMLQEFRAGVADIDDGRTDTEPLTDDLDTELGDSPSATQIAEALASAEVEEEAAPDLSGALPPPPPPLPPPPPGDLFTRPGADPYEPATRPATGRGGVAPRGAYPPPRPQMPRSATQRSVGWVVGLAIAVIGIGAVLVLSQFAEETTPLEDLAAGDCIIEPEGLLVEEVDRVDCAEPHNFEVFAIYRESGGPFPGDEALFTLAEVECGTYFESYVGVPFSESDVWYTYFTPTEDGWEQGDRDVTCMLYTLDGDFELATINGSLRSSRK